MLKILKEIIREPLVHFLLLGGLIYLYTSTNTQTDKTLQKPPINLRSYEITALKNTTGLTNETLLKNYLTYKKILLEEAYFLQLYKNDTEIEKILLKKMNFVLASALSTKDTNETLLKEYFQAHKEHFLPAKKYTLLLVYANTPKAKEILEQLSKLDKIPQSATQKLTFTPEEIAKKFGRYILLQITQLPYQHYSKPLSLQNGSFMFVKIVHKTPQDTDINFEEVEEQVYTEYRLREKEKTVQKAFEEIQGKYHLKELP